MRTGNGVRTKSIGLAGIIGRSECVRFDFVFLFRFQE